jgi:hypothetical protein
MIIEVEVKNVYGKDVFYPLCNQAILLARLTGNKTLTLDALNTIKGLGYEVAVQTPTYCI